MNVPPEPESEPTNTPESTERGEQLIVVGVGASAGGLEAFTKLLTHLPPATGMAFVPVQHLDAHHESVLPELMSVKTGRYVRDRERGSAGAVLGKRPVQAGTERDARISAIRY
jgi:two-component system CheB/CheR fusion protein